MSSEASQAPILVREGDILMDYDPEVQYRCTIIRGRAKNAMDDLLAAYASLIDELCPTTSESFHEQFNERLNRILMGAKEKTLNNHRTEIAGKLFGMFHSDESGTISPTDRTRKFLEDNDQPAFFKDVCFKFQFPNGMDKPATVKDRLSHGIRLRQFPYLIRFLLLSSIEGVEVTQSDVGYYILNSLHVLQGRVRPEMVLARLKADKKAGTVREVRADDYHQASYNRQHIREQLNLLELANLIKVDSEVVSLNMREKETLMYFAEFWDKPLPFDAYSYDFADPISVKKFYRDWQEYYGSLSDGANRFSTKLDNLIKNLPEPSKPTTVELGDEGERVVFAYEVERVRAYNPRLATKVLLLGKTKGLGYDIQSVVAKDGLDSDFVKYIEVKATKRVTIPDTQDPNWYDTVNLTRNEWVAATQHGRYYSIYRVYFTAEKTVIFVIENVNEKAEQGLVRAVPIDYRLDFGHKSIDQVMDLDE